LIVKHKLIGKLVFLIEIKSMPKDLAKNVTPKEGPKGDIGPQGPPGEGFSSSDIGVGPQGEQGPIGPKGDTGFIEDIANDANDRVITAVGDGTVNAESNLTFDGSILTVTGLTDTTTFSLGSVDITATGTEINTCCDATLTPDAATILPADQFIINDGGSPFGVMKQVQFSSLETYMETNLDTLGNVTSLGTLTGLNVSADATINSLTVGLGSGDVASNTAVGYQSLYANTTGANNVATGYQALWKNTEGNYNIATGPQALYNNTEGNSNVAIGWKALHKNITGGWNVATGMQTLYFNTEGDFNVASGYYALYANTTGASNVALGYKALNNNTEGDNNSGLGYLAGNTGTTGSNNTYLGHNALPSSITVSNEIVLGDTNVTAVRTDGTIYVAGLDIDGTGVTSTGTELNVIDGDTTATSTTLADADRVVVNDAGTMKQVALTDFETYFETALDTLGNVTSLGTLTSLTVDNIIIDGATIGHTGDTDLLSLASGELTVNGNIVIPDDAWIGGGSSQDRIIFDLGGNDITMETGTVIFFEYLQHYGDTNTSIRFQDDQISLRAGGTDYIDITSSGTNFADTEVVRPKLKDYSETVKVHGTKISSFNVDFEEGNVHSFQVGGALTVTITNPPATGIAGAMTLIITHGASSTLTWDPQIDWPGGNAPALTASGVDIVSLMTIDAGAIIYGFVGGINFS